MIIHDCSNSNGEKLESEKSSLRTRLTEEEHAMASKKDAFSVSIGQSLHTYFGIPLWARIEVSYLFQKYLRNV